jgi:glycerophosphoryl diester phosphodiesterase
VSGEIARRKERRPMSWSTSWTIAASAMGDFARSWRSLAITDLAYKLLAFALLTPAVGLLVRWLRSGTTSARVMADTDILRFFVTTRIGVLTLILGGSLILAITALEAACLMAIGLSEAKGAPLIPRSALAFGATRAVNVLRLTANMVVRLLAGLLPFLGAIGLVYGGLLREHDINFYLAQRPPEFQTAVVLAALVVLALATLLVWTLARWALALPLVLFEDVHPRRALGESARRSNGKRAVIVGVLAGWAVIAVCLPIAVKFLVETIGRSMAPHFSGSLALLIGFIAGLAILWFGSALAVGVVNFSLFALVVARLYLHVGDPREPRLPAATATPWLERLPGRVRIGLVAVVVLVAIGAALFAFSRTRGHGPALVIAHRGASAAAPENTLAAFRLAAEEGTDFVELDVQESADGEVLVVHDSDLMKVGGSPVKIWETSAAELRAVDVGSHAGPQFAGERVPTLAEALAVCKGRCRVVVELKSYGHDQKLVERVASIVEAAGMVNDCVFMSLDHDMVRQMKRLRPEWRTGVLVAKAVGDLTALGGDFVAVEARMATVPFVRRAHRAGQDVYVWTVNDPAWMLAALSRGVDGLITDRPGLARRVVARRDGMSDAQRLLVALLVRLGASTEALAAENALRP